MPYKVAYLRQWYPTALKFHPHAGRRNNAPEGGNLEGPPWNSAYYNHISMCPVALTMLHSTAPLPTTYCARFISFPEWITQTKQTNKQKPTWIQYWPAYLPTSCPTQISLWAFCLCSQHYSPPREKPSNVKSPQLLSTVCWYKKHASVPIYEVGVNITPVFSMSKPRQSRLSNTISLNYGTEPGLKCTFVTPEPSS